MDRISPRRSGALALVVALSLVAPPASAQTTIGAGGGSTISSWGKTDTQTYGQTFTTPSDSYLDSFSFWLGACTSCNASLDFRAYVYAWSGSGAAGSALFTSSVFHHNATSSTPFTQYSFNTGGLSLAPGSMYVAFLSTSGQAGSGRIRWELSTTDAYSGGAAVFQNNGENTALWTSQGWNTVFGRDMRFQAQFGPASVVPEPSTWLLLATGLLGIGFVAWRRREALA